MSATTVRVAPVHCGRADWDQAETYCCTPITSGDAAPPAGVPAPNAGQGWASPVLSLAGHNFDEENVS